MRSIVLFFIQSGESVYDPSHLKFIFKIHQLNIIKIKKDYKKRFMKDIKVFLEKKKKKKQYGLE